MLTTAPTHPSQPTNDAQWVDHLPEPAMLVDATGDSILALNNEVDPISWTA